MSQPPHILMCPPEYYGVHYEINPWMRRERVVDQALAARQWNDLCQILKDLGVNISLLEPIEGLPDLVFTANAALVYRHTVILSRFRPAQRQGEEPHNERWLQAAGFAVQRLPPAMYFEGAGDALFCGDTLFSGYRIRSDALSHQRVGALIQCRVIPLELVDPYFYHLDTCFCPLDSQTAIWFPGAFDDYGRRVLAEHIENLIVVDGDEARTFACNAVVVGRTVITNTGCRGLGSKLTQAGFTWLETALGEFVKAGGSAKCLTLRLDGEEAAAWRQQETSRPITPGHD